MLIARSTILLSREKRIAGLVDPVSVRLVSFFLRELGRIEILLAALLRCSSVRKALFFIESLILPGLSVHYALRKRKIYQLVNDVLRNGAQQLVILGAGFDPLPFLLRDRHPGVNFFEIDVEATQRFKRQALWRNEVRCDRIGFLACDLGRFSHADLKNLSEYDPAKPTLFVAEGLLMYFQFEAVERLLQEVRRSVIGVPEIIFTFLEPDGSGNGNFTVQNRWVRCWLALKQERFRWGVPASRIAEILQKAGYRTLSVFDPDESSLPVAPSRSLGEFICHARGEWG